MFKPDSFGVVHRGLGCSFMIRKHLNHLATITFDRLLARSLRDRSNMITFSGRILLAVMII
jgi:hypothetical protein